MSNLIEIQEAIEKLGPEERAESPNAISDLAEIVRFVAQDDPQAALRLGRQLADDADSLGRLLIVFQRSAAVQTSGS
jgi:hypothetical protein